MKIKVFSGDRELAKTRKRYRLTCGDLCRVEVQSSLHQWITGVLSYANGMISIFQGQSVACPGPKRIVSFNFVPQYFPGEGIFDLIGTKLAMCPPPDIPLINDPYHLLETLASRLETLKK